MPPRRRNEASSVASAASPLPFWHRRAPRRSFPRAFFEARALTVSNRIISRRTRISLSHEVGDKINVDSYRCAVRHLPAGTSGVVESLACLGLDGDCEEPRVPDPARDPAAPCDDLRSLGWSKGRLQPPVGACAFRVFPGADVPVLQRQCPHLRVGYSVLGFAAHCVGSLVHARRARKDLPLE